MKNTFIFNFKRDLAFSFVEKRSGTFLNQILDHIWTLFLLFCIYIKVNRKLKMPLTGFELWISGVWNNHSTNCAPQPLPKTRYLLLMSSCIPQSWYKTFMCFKWVGYESSKWRRESGYNESRFVEPENTYSLCMEKYHCRYIHNLKFD